jgi:hypothetical protein
VNGSPEREEELFRQAVAAFEAGDFETAEDLFRQVVAIGGNRRLEAERYLKKIPAPKADLSLIAPPSPPPAAPASQATSTVTPPFPPVLSDGVQCSTDWTVLETTTGPLPELAFPQPLRRTPHMDIFPAPPVAPETRLKVTVYTDAQAMRQLEAGDDLILKGSPDQNSFDVQVWLVVGGPFTIEGPAVRTLTILRTQERSPDLEFTVVRKAAGTASGTTATFSAYFAYDGRACGKVSRAVPLATGDEVPVATGGGAGVRIEAGAAPADLNVRIVAREDDERSFECHVQTRLLPQYENGETGPWRLKSLAADLVGKQMERFTASEATNKVRTLALRGAGIQLFEAAPKIFQKVFWAMIDAGKPPRTISIVTEEPYIPWELMVPTRTGRSGEDEQRQPLGVEFLIGRWTSRQHVAAPQHIPIRDSWVIAPRDSELANAEEEAAMVLREIPGVRIDPACIGGLEAEFAQQGRTLLHFVCHGKSGSGGQVLELENDEELETSYLRALPPMSKLVFWASRPLVFLNACEVGREEPALVGVGGFAEQFMILGASGVIAPLWSVRDSIAHQVAVEFYERIEKEPRTPFAEILRDLRRRSYADGGGEDTWAAYTFYGDPLAARS